MTDWERMQAYKDRADEWAAKNPPVRGWPAYEYGIWMEGEIQRLRKALEGPKPEPTMEDLKDFNDPDERAAIREHIRKSE